MATTTSATEGKKRRRTKKTAAAVKKPTTKKSKVKKSEHVTQESVPTPPPVRTLLIDNGGDTLKYGWMDSNTNIKTLPNISARLMHQFTILVGDELNRVQNPNSLMARTRSTERGMICNLENQTRVWKRMLDLLGVSVPVHTITAKCLGWKVRKSSNVASKNKNKQRGMGPSADILPEPTIPTHTIGVILLLPPHCPRVLLDQIITIWMEDFGVSHVGLGISSVCASYDQSLSTPWKTSCTVDLGWSSTLIVPTFRNRLIKRSQSSLSNKEIKIQSDENKTISTTIRRLPIGGRHMINMLKYYLTYRQYNLMDQEFLLRDIFERLSFLSTDINADLKLARIKPSGRRIYDRDFVLPDYKNTTNGEIRIPLLLQNDLEKEKRKLMSDTRQNEDNDDDDDDDDDDDENFDDADEDDDDSENDGDFQDGGKNNKNCYTKEKRSKIKTDERKQTNDDLESVEDEEETMEEKHKRLLRERAEDARRKREQEDEEQVLRLSVERFTVPEVLFRPIDAGLQPDLVGLSQAIVQSVEACPEHYRPALYRTVYLVGGVARLPNLTERLTRELRSLVPSEYDLKVVTAADSPIEYLAWLGAKAFFEQEDYTKYTVSQQEWLESSKRKAYKKLLIENGGCYE